MYTVYAVYSLHFPPINRTNSISNPVMRMDTPIVHPPPPVKDDQETSPPRDFLETPHPQRNPPRSLLREAIEGRGEAAQANPFSGQQPVYETLRKEPVDASLTPTEWGFHTGNNWTPSSVSTGTGRSFGIPLGAIASSSPPLFCADFSSGVPSADLPPLHRVTRQALMGNQGSRPASLASTERGIGGRPDAGGDERPYLTSSGVAPAAAVVSGGNRSPDGTRDLPPHLEEGPMLRRQPYVVFEPSRLQQRQSTTSESSKSVPSPSRHSPRRRQHQNAGMSSFDWVPSDHHRQPSLDERNAIIFDMSMTSCPSSRGGTNAVCAESYAAPPVSLGSLGLSRSCSSRRHSDIELPLGQLRKPSVPLSSSSAGQVAYPDFGRRCMSTRELGSSAPLFSQYFPKRQQKELIALTMQQRLMTLRESSMSLEKAMMSTPLPPQTNSSTTTALRITNEQRNQRRAEHNKAVVDDLCDIVADLFLAESKLVHPPMQHNCKESVQAAVHQFVTALPLRYALSVDAPSEVLVHMRLMAAARTDNAKAAVHIVNLERPPSPEVQGQDRVDSSGERTKQTRLVTISCADADGLLEYLTKLLGTGGSRVIDADVMLSHDNIVLDRFVVEMKGRLRLDKLQQYIESYLRRYRATDDQPSDAARPAVLSSTPEDDHPSSAPPTPVQPSSPQSSAYGPLYFDPPRQGTRQSSRKNLEEEMQSAVPLARVICSGDSLSCPLSALTLTLSRQDSVHEEPPESVRCRANTDPVQPASSETIDKREPVLETGVAQQQSSGAAASEQDCAIQKNAERNPRPPLVNRPAVHSFDMFDMAGDDGVFEEPTMHFIPLDELMIIETLGKGRISTVYRAAWQHSSAAPVQDAVETPANPAQAPLEIALKVATVGPDGSGMSDIEELEREAEIASQLNHDNICKLVGVSTEPDCFCLAYDYCEGGTLSSLITDTSRCYEYLPIALDVANGMAYLHSMNVIHRDLKPANILLTKTNRAKVSDFGMSVANTGQELTAETGTYRWMAPEVIRHESYSSNADVYSFGLVLWQLITREIPFATKTPVQAAYAVAEGHRPEIPRSVPKALRRIIEACWDEDQHRRPSFTYITMALADYAKMAFDPSNVGIQTVRIADEMLANVQGNSTVNVDSSAPVLQKRTRSQSSPSLNAYGADAGREPRRHFLPQGVEACNNNSDVGLEIW